MAPLTWYLYLMLSISFLSGQRIGSDPYDEKEICLTVNIMTIPALQKLKNCVVIVGSLRILLLERVNKKDFKNVTFPKLREVTGYILLYRISALESLGELFPNLARIRGDEVFGNYGLVVHDLQNLAEVGLYSLIKIDRGGVIIWGGPQTCFEDTIDWNTIAPNHRHVLIPSIRPAHCNVSCRCSLNSATNHCWNNWKCQRYVTGPDAEECHDQCFGCRKTNPDECSLCRNYTHRRHCVEKCPADTIVLEQNKYCLTEAECYRLSGWSWDGSCIFRCPIDYKVDRKNVFNITCVPCNNCSKTCSTQKIYTLRDIKAADRCVYIKGSLIIHLKSMQGDEMVELRLNEYLSRIEEVSDYVEIYGSNSISSLDFFTSLKRIRGLNLKDKKYSLLITDMQNIQSLFSTNVTNNLLIDKGTLGIYRNPMLCVSEIQKLQSRFPVKPNEQDIPEKMNGYSASGCDKIAVALQIKVMNETSALATFSPDDSQSLHYTILYVRVPPNTHTMMVPESCSELEWFSITADPKLGHSAVELNSLRPASTYAICVESYDPVRSLLARSAIANFTTPVGKPAPPFISELVASADGIIVIRWADHMDYKMHITHYELYVILVDFKPTIVKARNYCNDTLDYTYDNIDDSRHAIVMRPPPEYNKVCESMCGELSSDTKGAMIRENFDICSSINNFNGCENEENFLKVNKTIGAFVKTLFIEIKGPKEEFQVGGLAPYHDYRFKLRACTTSKCSRSARGVVRTFPSKNADLVAISSVKVNENGEMSVEWQPPNVTNGPIMSYSVQVFPVRILSEMGSAMIQEWCVSSDQRRQGVRLEKTNKYKVRVCVTSLASTSCSQWKTVNTTKDPSPKWMWWSGITSGIILCVVSTVVAKFWKPTRHNDMMLLVDETSMYRGESEPVTFMMTDFAPIYSIPLRGTNNETLL